uniref:Integrase zinc-binding domain-containing protein n=1 Tax=Tanacetum cinerariifolium TaxID=118510 RepID=A0A6L2K765_TANCI|nr:hypothetical protein [Tanacetum cinerariifolium]
MRVHEEDIPKTAFKTWYGHFGFTIMPFRLTNAPTSKEDHEVHLKLVLELLKKEKLFAKFSKSEFWLQEVHFLGYVVNRNDIHVDPKESEVIVRSGSKGSLQTLKDNLCNAPILLLPNRAEDFVDNLYHKILHIFDQKELNMCQRRLIELFKDYDCEICYHPEEATVVVVALSRKEKVKPRLVRAIKNVVWLGSTNGKKDGGLYFVDRIWIPLIGDVRTIIMDVAHAMRYSAHLGADKMYYDLQEMYWWPEIPEWNGTKLPWILSLSCQGQVVDMIRFRKSIDWTRMVQETTGKVILIKEGLKADRDCQNSYVGNRCKQLGFEVGDKVILEVSSWKGVVHLERKTC